MGLLSRICLPCRLRMARQQHRLLLNPSCLSRGIRIRRLADDIAMDKKYDQLLYDIDQQSDDSKEVDMGGEDVVDASYDALVDSPEETISRWKKFYSKYDYPVATHLINQLDDSLEGQVVVIHGYFITPRLRKNLSFFSLIDFAKNRAQIQFAKDRPLQIVSSVHLGSSDETIQSHKLVRSLKPYTPVAVVGRVVIPAGPSERRITPRSVQEGVVNEVSEDFDKQERFQTKNVNIEIRLEKLYKLNDISEDVMITKDSVFGPKDRHLQLRHDPNFRKAMRIRAKAASLCRAFLDDQGFLEVETPLLFKSTPEGAREFLVPTRNKGLMYALPQSPQQYKQVLMASGVHRYYQLARCFRDEDLRADRQPEFTQLDLEMSFTRSSGVIEVINELVKHLWKNILGKDFFRIWEFTYEMVIRRYGSDKPDLRYNHSRIRDISAILPYLKTTDDEIVEAFVLETYLDPDLYNVDMGQNLHDSVFSREELKEQEGENPVISFAGRSSRNAHCIQNPSDIDFLRRFLSAVNDQILVIHTRKRRALGGNTKLGLIRDALLSEAFSHGLVHRLNRDMFVWVTEFPLFKPSSAAEPGQEGASGLSATHHPFTAPMLDDIQLLETDPLSVRAEHYDLVCNGVEVGGGSARIHDPELQRYILEEIIKVPEKRMKQFDHLFRALGSGCPPHAGIALGFDRLVAILHGTDSIRDVIAFPKNGKGQDMLVNSPGVVGDEELKPYFLRGVEKN